MRSVPLVDALLLVRNRKTVPHRNLAGRALSAALFPPPIYQAKPTLSFALSLASVARGGVRDPSGVEESEEFPEEGLESWNGQSNKR